MQNCKSGFISEDFIAFIGFVLILFVLFLPPAYNASKIIESKTSPIVLVDKYHKDGDCYTDGNNQVFCDDDEFIAVLGDRSKVRISQSNFRNIQVGQSYQLTEEIGRLGWVVRRSIN